MHKALGFSLYCCTLLSLLPTAAIATTCQTQPGHVATFEDGIPSAGFAWFPQIAPQGPVVIIVSLPEQRAYVYRNGVRIGLSKVSTGKPGFETPTGVFEILQKRREHYSSLYNDAPMPFMQRLTWDGIALHAGQVPDHPASHGCIRLPYAFSEALFAVTSRGMTVIVTDEMIEPSIEFPALFATSAKGPAVVHVNEVPAKTSYRWSPELAPEGPIAVLLSTHDQEVRVLRNAIEIGRAPVELSADPLRGTRVYVLLKGTGEGTGISPNRPPLRWQQIPLVEDPAVGPHDLREIVASGKLQVDPDFARDVYDVLLPGTTLLVTDRPLRPFMTSKLPILSADKPQTTTSAPVPD